MKKVLARVISAVIMFFGLMNISPVTACCPSGDANGDGILNAIDAAYILSLLAQNGVEDDPENPVLVRVHDFDFDQDSRVTVCDVAIMLQWSADEAVNGR